MNFEMFIEMYWNTQILFKHTKFHMNVIEMSLIECIAMYCIEMSLIICIAMHWFEHGFNWLMYWLTCICIVLYYIFAIKVMALDPWDSLSNWELIGIDVNSS